MVVKEETLNGGNTPASIEVMAGAGNVTETPSVVFESVWRTTPKEVDGFPQFSRDCKATSFNI